MKTAFCNYLILLLLAPICPSLAQTSEEPQSENFREKCRKRVSGAFADSWNDGNRARDAEVLAKKALQKLRAVQEKNNKTLREIQEKIAKENYDPNLIRSRDETVAQIRLYHEQIATQEDSSEVARKESVSAEARHKELKQVVMKIYDVFFVDDPEGAPRKIFQKLTWKSSCPKYRSLCPLPSNDAKTLKKIATLLKDPEENCLKYSNLR